MTPRSRAPRYSGNSAVSAIEAAGAGVGYVRWFLLSRVLSAGTSAVLGIASFAVAGAANVGTYAALVAVTAFAGGMAGGWLSQGVMRFHQLSRMAPAALVRWSAGRGIAFTVIVLTIGAAIAGALPIGMHAGFAATFAVAWLEAAAFATVSARLGSAMARSRGPRVVVLEFGRASAVALPPLVSTILPGWGPYSLRCLIIGTVILWLAIAVSSLDRRANFVKVDGDDQLYPSTSTFFAYGAPLGVWIGLSGVYQNADRVLLAWLASESVAGRYSLLYDISSRGVLLPITALSGALGASVLRMFNSGAGSAASAANRRLALTQAIALLVLAVPFAVACMAATLVVPWFKVEHAITAVIVYGAAGVWALGDTLQRERLGTGSTARLVVWIAVCAAVNVGLNILLIPHFGIVGAGLVTLGTASLYVIAVMFDVGMLTMRGGAGR